MKRIATIALLALVGFVVYGVYGYYSAGYHTLPEMPQGAFPVRFDSFRGIVVDLPDEKATRRYLGLPLEVPFYLEDSWSWCHAPTEDEVAKAAPLMAERNYPGQRLEAVCKFTIEDEEVVRGLILTVPRV